MCRRRRRSGHRRVLRPGHGQGDPRPGHWSPDPAPRPPRPRHCRTRETVYAAAAAAAVRRPTATGHAGESRDPRKRWSNGARRAPHRCRIRFDRVTVEAVTLDPPKSTDEVPWVYHDDLAGERPRRCSRGIDHRKISGEAGLCDDVKGIGKHPYAASRCKSAGRPFNFVPFLIGIVEAATGCPALLRLIGQRGAAGRRHRHPAAIWHGEAKRRTAKNSDRRVGMLIARKEPAGQTPSDRWPG